VNQFEKLLVVFFYYRIKDGGKKGRVLSFIWRRSLECVDLYLHFQCTVMPRCSITNYTFMDSYLSFPLCKEKWSLSPLLVPSPLDSDCLCRGPCSVVGIATGYGLDGPLVESRWGARFSAPVQTGPGHTQAPVQ